MNPVTIVYGVGAQKSGSTWLHSYLASHPQCHFRRLKELHYFDSLDGLAKNRRQAIRLRAEKMKRRASEKWFWQRRKVQDRIDAIEEWLDVFDGSTPVHDKYLAYLMKGRRNEPLIGEVTPEYSIVSEARLAEMVALSPRTKFIYLMRDPFERSWSHIRMTAKRDTRNNNDFVELALKTTDDFLAGRCEAVRVRSDYKAAIERLTKVVPREDLLFEFYEDLFSESALLRITDFLGIAPHKGETEEVVHLGKSLKLDETRKKEMIKLLVPQYEYVSQFFDGHIPERWTENWQSI